MNGTGRWAAGNEIKREKKVAIDATVARSSQTPKPEPAEPAAAAAAPPTLSDPPAARTAAVATPAALDGGRPVVTGARPWLTAAEISTHDRTRAADPLTGRANVSDAASSGAAARDDSDLPAPTGAA